MLSALLAPGNRLMRNLRMPAKFATIVVALLIPLCMLLALYVNKANADIGFARVELDGVTHHRQLNALLEASLQERAPGSADDRMVRLIDGYAQLAGKDDPFEVAPLLIGLKKSWAAAQQNRTDQGKSLAADAAVSAALAGLRRHVSEASALSLDPDVDSYYLMVAATDKLPVVIEQLAPMRDLSAAISAKPDPAGAEQLALAAAVALARVHGEDAHDALARVAKVNAPLLDKADLDTFVANLGYQTSLQEMLAGGNKGDTGAMLANGSRAIARTSALNKFLLDKLELALQARITQLAGERNLMLGGVALALVLAGYALLAFYMTAQSGFQAIDARVVRLGVGDLRPTYLAKGTDEIASSINQFRSGVASLATIVRGVRESAESISVATSEIAAGNNDLAERGARIAGTVQQTAVNMGSLADKVTSNLEHARHGEQLALSALKVARSGETVVSQAVTTMGRIAISSRKIGDITEVINAIAFQTNILALNAAVEAARAGEQGRGFAVVATEVRSLAQRSASAAKEIGDLIRTSVADVSEGEQYVNQAGATMGEIVASVQSVNEVMDQITAASHGQSDEIQSMVQAVSEVDASTQQNAAMVEQISAAVMSLDERARFLSDSVRSFQVDADVSLQLVTPQAKPSPVQRLAPPRLRHKLA